MRCWGNGVDGRLGYGERDPIGDNEHPDIRRPGRPRRSRHRDQRGQPHLRAARRRHRALLGAGRRRPARLRQHERHRRRRGPRLGRAGRPSAAPPRRSARARRTAARGSPTAPCAAGARATSAGSATATRPTSATTRRRRRRARSTSTPAASRSRDAAVLRGQTPAQTTMTFTVGLSAASDEPASVSFATADADAGAPSDYTAAQRHAHVRAWRHDADVTVQVEGDAVDEPDERFVVNLSRPGRASRSARPGHRDDRRRRHAARQARPPPPPAAADPLAEALRPQARRAADLRACRTSATTSGAPRAAMRAAATGASRRCCARVLRQIDSDGRAAARALPQDVRAHARARDRRSPLAARRRTAVVLEFAAAGSDGIEAARRARLPRQAVAAPDPHDARLRARAGAVQGDVQLRRHARRRGPSS